MWNYSTLLAEGSDHWMSVVTDWANGRIKMAEENIEFLSWTESMLRLRESRSELIANFH